MPPVKSISRNRRAMLELIQRYEHGMEAAIQMQTSLYNVKVVFEGTRAYTDGTTITLPNVRVFATHDKITDEDVENASAYFMALRGYAWQQAARIIESDLSLLATWGKQRGSFALALHNALDDIRIEHRFSKTAPGIKEAIDFMRETWLWPRYIRKKARGEFDVLYEMLIGLQCFMKHFETIDEHPLWQVLDPAVQSWVRRNQDDLDAAYDTLKMEKRKGTERLIECVERMLSRWNEEYNLVEPLVPANDIEADDDSKVKKSDGMFDAFFKSLNRKLRADRKKLTSKEGDDEEDPIDDIGSLLTNAMKPPLLFVTLGPRVTTLVSASFADAYVQRVEPVPAMEDKESWERLSKLAPHESRTLVIHPPDPRLEQALDQAMGQMIAAMTNASREMEKQAQKAVEDAQTHIERLPEDQKQYLVYTTKNDEYAQTPEGSPTELKQMRDHVMQHVGVVKNRLQVLLRARTRTKWRGNREEGEELDQNAVADIAMGKILVNNDPRPFRTRVEADDLLDTNCMLLMDSSGSMFGRKLQLARWAALCFAEALDLAKVKFALAAFSSREDAWDEPYVNANEVDRELYGRFGALYIETCKTFDEPWRAVQNRVPRLGAVNEANYDADSVYWAAQQLLARKASRRVLFVFSDGLPATSEMPLQRARQQRHLGDVVKAMVAKGVEVVGIGICDASVRHYYPQHVVINNAPDLPKAVMSQMEFLLLNRRARR